MDLTESQGKELFRQYKLPVPRALLASTQEQAAAAAAKLVSNPGGKIVLKAQVPTGHRKKLGGIEIVSASKAGKKAQRLLSKKIKNFEIDSLLVEQYVSLKEEWYLSLLLNRQNRQIELLFSKRGGIDIETVSPKFITRVAIDSNGPGSVKKAIRAACQEALPNNLDLSEQLETITSSLYALMLKEDALLVEVNPLGLDTEGKLWLLDSKISLDDAAAYRHEWSPVHSQDPFEERAERADVAFVKLDGNIGVVGNGAGLVMATVDILHEYSLSAANFLDIGGGAGQARMEAALTIVASQPDLHAVFINIFGGITRTDEIAKGIVAFIKQHPLRIPLVVRLTGTKQKEGLAILKDASIHAFATIQEAITRLQKEVEHVG